MTTTASTRRCCSTGPSKTARTAKTSPPLLGFADDNYRDGTQSFVFSFVSPALTDLGYGLSTTEIHEYGHHLNFSHPHDGYDYERDVEYGPVGRPPIRVVGDETTSIMSYMTSTGTTPNSTGQRNRFQAAGYINNANALAARILASPDAVKAAADLAIAGIHYERAKDGHGEPQVRKDFQPGQTGLRGHPQGRAEPAWTPKRAERSHRLPADQRSRQSLEQEIPPAYIDKGRINLDPGARITPEDQADPISKRFLP